MEVNESESWQVTVGMSLRRVARMTKWPPRTGCRRAQAMEYPAPTWWLTHSYTRQTGAGLVDGDFRVSKLYGVNMYSSRRDDLLADFGKARKCCTPSKELAEYVDSNVPDSRSMVASSFQRADTG